MPRIPSSQSNAEKAAGRKAAKLLRPHLQRQISSVFQKKSGELESIKTGIKSRRGTGELQGITVRMPFYGFILHHGFQGRKSNSVFQRLKKTLWIQDAIDRSNVPETLADDISDIRAEQVVSNINF